jgi:hypothetical protein
MEEHPNAVIRAYLKIVRDPSKTAYDTLPNGETIGSFANKRALYRYGNKNDMKRARAKQRSKGRFKNFKTH